MKSETINELAAALSKAQGQMSSPPKNRTAKVQMKGGGAYSYNYCDLKDVMDAIRKPFADNGLSIIQTPYTTDGSIGIKTTILHTSGQWFDGEMSLKETDNRPQTAGSLITFLRRYMMCMTGVVTDADDDASLAQGHQAELGVREKNALAPAEPQAKPAPFQDNLYHASPADKRWLADQCKAGGVNDKEHWTILSGLMEGKDKGDLAGLITKARKELQSL